MQNKILYFGYGANRNKDMMKAIIGRTPLSYPATISGFELCIQKWEEIPANVRQILTAWDSNFRTYVIRPTAGLSKTVKGTVWEITKEERRLIDNWEMTGLWYSIYFLTIQKAKTKLQLELQIIDDPKIKQKVDGSNYKTFLNPKIEMIIHAQKCREDFIAQN